MTTFTRPATISNLPTGTYPTWDGSEAAMCDLVKRMRRAGVRVLAIDWDQTFLRCHTKSQWYGSASELRNHIRPSICALVRAAHKAGLYVSIVTFSDQVHLIHEVLDMVFPNITRSTRPFVVRGNCGTWSVCPKSHTNSFVPEDMKQRGKIPHILSVIQNLPSCQQEGKTKEVGSIITSPNHVVLIDDDVNNIQTAMACRFHAFWMNPENTGAVWNQMSALFSSV